MIHSHTVKSRPILGKEETRKLATESETEGGAGPFTSKAALGPKTQPGQGCQIASFYAKFYDFGVLWKPFGFEKSAWHPGAFLASFCTPESNDKLMQKTKVLTF